jgi:hypothetical protein
LLLALLHYLTVATLLEVPDTRLRRISLILMHCLLSRRNAALLHVCYLLMSMLISTLWGLIHPIGSWCVHCTCWPSRGCIASHHHTTSGSIYSIFSIKTTGLTILMSVLINTFDTTLKCSLLFNTEKLVLLYLTLATSKIIAYMAFRPFYHQGVSW